MRGRRAAWAVAIAFVVCAVGLSILHRQTRPRYRLSPGAAIAAARANPADHRFLAANPTTGARVIPLDAKLQRVTFFDGAQVVLDAAVGEHGEVLANEEHLAGAPASGATLANAPWLLALLSAVFLLATLVVPLRRMRNLDALVLAGLTVTVPLINARLVGASVACAYVALGYLMLRCAYVGLRGEAIAARAPDTPLLSRVCAGWEPRRRGALPRLLVAATALAFAMITLSSSGYTDVAAASLQGATDVLHGVLPYGHIDVALHGDTYPLVNYVMYIPGALWHPVSNAFSDPSGSLGTALAASLLAAVALHRVAGVRATLAWLSFPPVLLAASGGANDIALAACLAWMLALHRRMAGSMLMLAMGVWVKLVPLVLIAVWLPHGRRQRVRAYMPALGLSAALAGLLLALGGAGGVPAMLGAMSFQFQRGSFFAPWYTFSLQWLQPFAQAAVLALLLAAVLRLRADRSLRDDLVRLSALAGALLIGVQLAANYWTWSYLPWVLPFLLVALLMPDGAPFEPAHSQARPGAGRGTRSTATPPRPPDRLRSPSAVGSAR